MSEMTSSNSAQLIAAPPQAASRASLRRVLRRSGFLVGALHAVRGLVRDARVATWLLARPGKIRRYLAEHQARRSLHVGTSHNILSGWLNTDLDVEHPSVTYLDATQRFPFEDAVFDDVMAEHMIEHIDYESGQAMLRECLRVLKPGGRIRLATPDLRVLLELYTTTQQTPMQRRYVGWMVQRVLPGVDHCHELFVINTAVRAWGHQFLYDNPSLHQALERAGFEAVSLHRPGESDDPHLCGLEAHGREIQAEDINQFETIVLQARKPLPRAVGV